MNDPKDTSEAKGRKLPKRQRELLQKLAAAKTKYWIPWCGAPRAVLMIDGDYSGFEDFLFFRLRRAGLVAFEPGGLATDVIITDAGKAALQQ